MQSVVAVIPAAGSGSRFGGEVPKSLLKLGGKTVLGQAISRLREAGVERLVVAVEASQRQRLEQELNDVLVVTGGATRQASVQAGVQAAGECDLILVHDAARPAVNPTDVQNTVAAAKTAEGAVLGRAMVDTVKRIEGDRIVETVDRSSLFRAETPQVFRRQVLLEAFEQANRDAFLGTDEASLVERNPDHRVLRVEATAPNPKLTYPSDWALIERLVTASQTETVAAKGTGRPA